MEGEIRRLELDRAQANVCALLANINRNPELRRHAFVREEFLLWPAPGAIAQASHAPDHDQQTIKKIHTLALILGAEVKV